MAEINVTPMVDVMLVLLVIFMVTAPLLTAAVPVDLPDSRAKAQEQDSQQITISLDSGGTLYLDDQPIDQDELGARLAQVPPGADGKPPQVVLRADRALDYGRVMTVMGELNHAGFNAIQLVTNGSAGPQ